MRRKNEHEERFEFEEWLASRAERNDLATQSAKAASILNGGGSVAMLGLLQALVQKTPQFIAFRPFGIFAMLIFVVGAAASAWVFVVRWMHASWMEFEGPVADQRARFYRRAAIALMMVPLTLFWLGCCVAAIGIMRI